MGEVGPRSVGLGGDGDEVTAIEEVERTFGVQLDKIDASKWVTAGDVFASLQKALPCIRADDPATWRRFAEALTDETGVDAASITADSPLLSNIRVPYWLIGIVFGGLCALAFL
jgi:hypothetical protein